MTDLRHAADSWPSPPPLKNGLPLIVFCLLALPYAWLAIPATLLPIEGLLNANGGLAGNDFLAFYSAALLTWSHSAASVFDLSQLFAFQDSVSGAASHLPFPYPPFFLFYIAPLAITGYLPALYVWLAATSLPLILIIRKVSGLAVPIILLAPPLIQNTIDGQNGALTASLFAGGLMLLACKRPMLAGILFGLLSYKPQVFILIPICLLAAREYRALASLIATGVFLVLASTMAFGLEIWWRFAALLPQQLAFVLEGRLPVTRCPTLFMLAFHTFGNLALANAVQFCSTATAWVLVGWSWFRTNAIFPRALAFCIALPLSTPYMLEYDLAVWTLPACILLTRLWRNGGTWADWSALSLLWFLPPLIWLTSPAHLYLSALAILPLVPYTIKVVFREDQPWVLPIAHAQPHGRAA